jgi:hypothetical protein
MDVIALLTGSAGSRRNSRGGSRGGANVRSGTPGIIEEKAPELFTLGEREKEKQDDLGEFLMGNSPVDKLASGGMIQSSYGNLFDKIHQPKQTSDSTLNDLLRIVGSK